MGIFDDRDGTNMAGGRVLWGRLGIVAAIGVAGFGITAAARSGEEDATTAPASTAAPASNAPPTPTPAPSERPSAPFVVEVPMRILAALVRTDLPEGDVADEGVELQTSVTEMLSPVVGEAMIPSGSGPDPASWTPAPPVFAVSLGLPVSDPDAENDEASDIGATAVPDLDNMPEPIEIPGDALDDVLRAAAEDQTPDVDPEWPPQLGEPIMLDDGDTGGDGVTGFIDPCAEAEDDRCPDPGEPATVVGYFGQQIPPPLAIVVTANPTGECGADVADDELRLAIESTTPIAELQLGYWRNVRSFANPNVDIVTPEDTAAAWMAAFEEAAIDGPPPPPIMHCLTLTGITTRDAAGYRYRIDALDVFDQVWLSERQAWASPYFTTELQIPLTLVWPLTDNEVLVSAAHRTDQIVGIHAYRRTGAASAGDPCRVTGARPPGYDEAVAPRAILRSTTTPAELIAAGQNPAYVHRRSGTMRLAEGSIYRLCVYWSVAVPSFSAGVQRTVGYDLITPDALNTSFTLVDFDIDGTDRAGLDPGDLSVSIWPASRALMVDHTGCQAWINPISIEASVTVDDVICDVDPDATALYRGGAVVAINTLDLDGVRRQSRHVIRTHSCTGLCVPPESQYFRVELPTGAPARDFWCGGVGDACDRPTDRSYGTVLIRVDYANDAGDSSARWSVSAPTDLGDERPGPPETPQLDTSQHPRADGPVRSRTVTVPIVADRQVTVEAELLKTGSADPCVNEGGATTAASDRFAEQHTITFDGLCPGQGLYVVVTLTDRSGNSSVWHADPGGAGLPADAQLWYRGVVSVPQLRWEYSTSIQFTLPTPMYRLHGLGVSLDGSDATGGTWYPVDPRPGSTIGCTGASGPITTRPLASDNSSRRHAVPGAVIGMTIVVDVELLEGSCRLPAGGFEQSGPHVFRLDLPFEDIVIGEPYVVEGSMPIAGLRDPAAAIDVVGTITIVSET